MQDDYYKPIRAGNFWKNNYIRYKSNGIKIKSGKKYLNESKPYCN